MNRDGSLAGRQVGGEFDPQGALSDTVPDAVVSVGYSVAPGATYPTATHQVNDALAYIQQDAARLPVDPDRIVLAGDSAGAQITSQIAAFVTNPA